MLQLAHCIPLSGHLGKDKTEKCIFQHFYWPTLYRDVAEYCQTSEEPTLYGDVAEYCQTREECQKVYIQKDRCAPLMPLPVIEEPFSRIAMDIIGPLPKSGSDKRYVLVVCDYATRYPPSQKTSE